MRVETDNRGIVVEGLRDFYPKHVFECGQAFRWNWDGRGYVGVVGNRVTRVVWKDATLYMEGVGEDDFYNIWTPYLDLDRDYGAIKDKLAGDAVMDKAMEHGFGIRILNQDPWETLISFIISANNGIVRIKNIIEKLAQSFGEEVLWEGEKYYLFPEADRLADAHEEEIRASGCGYRAPYIKGTAELVRSAQMDIYELKDIPYKDAKDALMKCPGVGPKVADCVLLFSLGKREAFPVDTWVKRIMGELYAEELKEYRDIHALAEDRFGFLGGYAQQYLFYYAREMKIGK